MDYGSRRIALLTPAAAMQPALEPRSALWRLFHLTVSLIASIVRLSIGTAYPLRPALPSRDPSQDLLQSLRCMVQQSTDVCKYSATLILG